MREINTDFLVIGSGVAGLATALWSSQHGEVIVLAKNRVDDCNTALAQGGIAAAIGKHDSAQLHHKDTIIAGAGSCKSDTVKVLTDEAPSIIKTLFEWGVNFDLDESGIPALAKEGAHSLARVLHHGDSTGAEIWRALSAKLSQTPSAKLVSETYVFELVLDCGRCCGVLAETEGEVVFYRARAVVLATGGCGRLYGRTTNSIFSTGDGLALAWRSGAELTDLEFIQFHPTALNYGPNPLFLISEAVRGDGAILVDASGSRFMPTYHPQADLAPRDIVSRAILAEQACGNEVFLDATSLAKTFPTRFPNIYAKLKQCGVNPLTDPIPVTPAAHFMIGGIQTDSNGRTNVHGLYACGETASTGVHGANRLASNSLLEGLVFGRRVAIDMAHSQYSAKLQSLSSGTSSDFSNIIKPKVLNPDDSRLKTLQDIMWSKVGIIRNGQKLSEALRQLNSLDLRVEPAEHELKNMLQVAKLMTQAALNRQESRGSHYRSDFPQVDENWQHRHLSPRRYSA